MIFLFLFLLPFVSYAQESLDAEGFPKDWQASDFMVEEVVPVVVSASVVSGSGPVSLPITALPRVAADPSLTPQLTSSSVQVDLPNPTPGLPVVAMDDVGRVPDDVAKLDVWGPFTDMSGGVSEKAWKGVRYGEVVAQLEGVRKGALESRVLQDLMTRLMLTRAWVEVDPSATAGVLLASRAGVLGRLGQDEQAYALWRNVPPLARNGDSVLSRGWAMSSVVAGQTTEPCALARKLVVDKADGPWGELAVVCTALDRNSGGLDFGLAVAAEQAGFDPVLRALLVAVRDDDVPAKLPPEGVISPLSAAVMATYPALLEPALMPKLPTVVLRRLLQTQALPLGLRMEAAEILMQRNPSVLMAESVRVLYEAQPIPPDQLVDALKVAASLTGISARTLLWQAVRTLPSNEDKAAAWRAFAVSASKDGRGLLPLWLTPVRAGIQPVVMASGDGLDVAVRGAWLAGDVKAASAWRGAAESVPSATTVLIGRRAQLGMEAAVMEGKISQPVLDQWLVARSMGDDAARLSAVRALAVLEGLGVKLPDGIWGKMEGMLAVQPDVMAGDMVKVEALKALAAKGVQGPVIVKVAGWNQEKPLAAWAPMEARAAVEALQVVGLKREAAALVMEFLAAKMPVVVEAKKVEVKAVEKKTGTLKIQGMPKSGGSGAK